MTEPTGNSKLFAELAERIGYTEMSVLCRAYLQKDDEEKLLNDARVKRAELNAIEEEEVRQSAYCLAEGICYTCFKSDPEKREPLVSKYRLCIVCDDTEIDRCRGIDFVINEVKPDTLQENACGCCGSSYAETFMACTDFNCAYDQREEYRQKFKNDLIPPPDSYEELRCSGSTLDAILSARLN